MARWTIVDSLSTPEQLFCSHISSWAHYLQEFGETVNANCISDLGSVGNDKVYRQLPHDGLGVDPDVLFVHDHYGVLGKWDAGKRIAQVASVHRVMPWDVRKKDGTPAYDLVLSSIPAMVEQARAAGCRAEFMPLAFDARARVCGMGVERKLECIFIGTVGPNHQRRAQLLHELRDIVKVLPPVFGRDYFKSLAGAAAVFSPHAEWAQGAVNNMRMFEACGMGAQPVGDGSWPLAVEPFGFLFDGTAEDARVTVEDAIACCDGYTAEGVLVNHTYESRVPELVALARSL